MTKDIVIPNVDLDILNLQHQDLIEKLWKEPDSLLWGLVEMLDYILTEYYEEPVDSDEYKMIGFGYNNEGNSNGS